MVPYLVTLTDL